MKNNIYGYELHKYNSIPIQYFILNASYNFPALNFEGGVAFCTSEQLQQAFARYTLKNFLSYTTDIDGVTADFTNKINSLWADCADDCLNMYNARYADYNPIENYSMTESGDDNTTGSSTTNTDSTGEDTRTITNTDTTTGNKEDNGNNNTTDNRYTYDSNSYSPVTQQQTVGNTTSTSTVTVNGDTTDTNNSTDTVTTTTTNNSDTTHKLTRSGNIGVTTTQEMITAEITLRITMTLLDMFVLRFIRRYCID